MYLGDTEHKENAEQQSFWQIKNNTIAKLPLFFDGVCRLSTSKKKNELYKYLHI